MRIYIAAPFAARTYAQQVSQDLQDAGYVITSSWLQGSRGIESDTIGASPGTDDETVRERALGDIADVLSSDLLLQLTSSAIRHALGDVPEEWLHTGGRHVEFGLAIVDSPLHLIGEPENIFTRTFATRHSSVEAFLAHIAENGPGESLPLEEVVAIVRRRNPEGS